MIGGTRKNPASEYNRRTAPAQAARWTHRLRRVSPGVGESPVSISDIQALEIAERSLSRVASRAERRIRAFPVTKSRAKADIEPASGNPRSPPDSQQEISPRREVAR